MLCSSPLSPSIKQTLERRKNILRLFIFSRGTIAPSCLTRTVTARGLYYVADQMIRIRSRPYQSAMLFFLPSIVTMIRPVSSWNASSKSNSRYYSDKAAGFSCVPDLKSVNIGTGPSAPKRQLELYFPSDIRFECYRELGKATFRLVHWFCGLVVAANQPKKPP